MVDKIKDDLLKSISYYYDIKLNTKYLIYFTVGNQQSSSMDANMLITNGVYTWSTCLTSDTFLNDVLRTQLNSKHSLLEFIGLLVHSLSSDKFELNKFMDTANLTDFVEFKLANEKLAGACKFILEPAKSSANDIKNLLFIMYDKLSKAEAEVKKLNEKADLSTGESGLVKMGSSDSNGAKGSSASDILRKFNIASGPAYSRKPGMSIINPLSKRRKAPKGVKFDDDDDEEEGEEEDSGSESNGSQNGAKALKTTK